MSSASHAADSSSGPDWSAWLGARQRALAEELRRRLGPGTPLPAPARAAFAGRLGYDLGQAVLHPAPIARPLAEALGAEAFTVGPHVVARSVLPSADPLLGHELTHVVQHVRPAAQPAATSVQRSLADGGESIAQRVELDMAASPSGSPVLTARGIDRTELAE